LFITLDTSFNIILNHGSLNSQTSANISETVQDRATVTIKQTTQYEMTLKAISVVRNICECNIEYGITILVMVN